jgi:energy-coupling factor transporter ATP-binding protein EcfA2
MQASVETTDSNLGLDINLTYQGTGIQKALSIIAALVFSPEGSTIIIEEPETNLHARSQEGLADLFNLAVNKWKKQVVFTTHSWDMLLPFVSDVGKGQKRGEQHPKANPGSFKLIVFRKVTRDGTEKIETTDLDIRDMDFMTLRDYLKKLWG